MSEAQIGYGTTFGISEDAGVSYPTLAEVFDITPPNATVDIIDVTHSQSPNRTREYLGGMVAPGECSLEMNFIPGSESDIKIRGLTGPQLCEITYPSGVRWQFEAILVGYEPSAPTDDKMTATLTFQVTSTIVSVPAA